VSVGSRLKKEKRVDEQEKKTRGDSNLVVARKDDRVSTDKKTGSFWNVRRRVKKILRRLGKDRVHEHRKSEKNLRITKKMVFMGGECKRGENPWRKRKRGGG